MQVVAGLVSVVVVVVVVVIVVVAIAVTAEVLVLVRVMDQEQCLELEEEEMVAQVSQERKGTAQGVLEAQKGLLPAQEMELVVLMVTRAAEMVETLIFLVTVLEEGQVET